MALTLALPRGRLFGPVAALLARAGVPVRLDDEDSRELTVARQGWRFLLARARDVGLYVEQGVAPLGVAGKDTLLEHPRAVIEVLDLGVGRCRLVVAAPHGREEGILRTYRRVATKYPRLTEDYFSKTATPVQVIQVHGAVELAASIGLADAVVDLTQTGETLRRNGLVEQAQVAVSTARLIVNPVAYRLGEPGVRQFIDRMREVYASGRRS